MNQRSYNFFGNLAVVNFDSGTSAKDKKKFALSLMKKNPAVKTVLEKSGHFKGRLRKMKTNYIAGVKTKEVLYKENNCVFRFNIDETYFSPRLSNERKEISDYIKSDSDVLVMFAGVAPFPIVIAKNSKAKRIYSNELNRKANEYAKRNVESNKVQNKVELIPGDIKKVAEKLKNGIKIPPIQPPTNSRPHSNFSGNLVKSFTYPSNRKHKFIQTLNQEKNKIPKTFDTIIMPRPQLKDSFLKQAFMLSKKGTRIYYYDFCKVDEIPKIVEKIKSEAKKYKKKIKIIKTKNAGELAPYKIRTRIDFRIMS